MARQTINLNDSTWRFGQVPCQPFTASNVYDLPNVTEWLPATVPGNVRTDLLALGRIPDPFFGQNYKESLWVEAVDWWYRRSIQTEPLRPTQRAFLIFEGIDYLSAIFVNGQEMTRHEGMFSRQIIEVTAALRTGVAEIEVRLWGSSALATRNLTRRQQLWQTFASRLFNSWAGIYPDRSATLKCQMSFGWDFAPPIRTMGLWDAASMVICGSVFMREAWVCPDLSDLRLNLMLDALQSQQVEATVRVTPANFQGQSFGPFHFSLNLPAGQSQHQIELHLPDVALWQPWDRGEPHLYTVDISISDQSGDLLDNTTLRTGFRSVELTRWQFQINDQRAFMRGLNWVPADCFPGRLRREDYARLLTQAKASGANLLRVWGGGLREKRVFYELCDELGLMVWQEFPFACLFLGSYPRDPTYLQKVKAECSAIVRQISHHPSLIVWCGGNEFSLWRNRPLIDTLRHVVQRYDRTRSFIPASPSHLDGGDAHNWDVWHSNDTFRAYQTETARFLSEFGLQALPHLDTLTAMLSDPGQDWETHHADRQTLERYANLFLARRPLSVTGHRSSVSSHQSSEKNDSSSNLPISQSPNLSISNLQSLISASQRAQATALQTAIEHMRRRKTETGGVCVWQFNEPWPAISWAIVDYFGRQKIAYQQLKDWYNLVLVSLNFPVGKRWRRGNLFEADIWAINDSLRDYKDCDLQIDLDGRPIYTQCLNLPADSACCVGHLSHRLSYPPQRLTLVLHRQLKILARNSYDLAWSDTTRISLYRRFRRWVADWVLR